MSENMDDEVTKDIAQAIAGVLFAHIGEDICIALFERIEQEVTQLSGNPACAFSTCPGDVRVMTRIGEMACTFFMDHREVDDDELEDEMQDFIDFPCPPTLH